MSEEVTTGTVTVDEEQIQFPRTLDPASTYDVLLNDRHVWSLNPARDTESRHGHPVADWPEALRPYLGAEVITREGELAG